MYSATQGVGCARGIGAHMLCLSQRMMHGDCLVVFLI